jgi:hypothetical protein
MRVGGQAVGNLRDLLSERQSSVAHANRQLSAVSCQRGVVTLGENSLISAIEQQAKSLKSLASAFAVIGEFRSI